jgi:signal transduction histidine kinase/ligand-binding sensor domain-containing protein
VSSLLCGRRQSVLLMLLAVALPALASPTDLGWSMRSWLSEDGLPDNTVVGIEQTPDGFLWIATQGGLVRFDGVKFQEFAPVTAAGEPTSLIQSLFLSPRGRLWVAKDRGVVVCVDGNRTSALTSSNGLSVLPVRAVLEDSEGDLWVSYIGGGVIRVRDGKAHTFASEDGMPDGGTCQLIADFHGQLWFAKGGHVGVFRNGRFISLTYISGVQRISAARSGGIWACMGRTLFQFTEGGQVQVLGTLPEKSDVNPTVLLEDHAGAVWIGTRNAGLFRYQGSRFVRVLASPGEIASLQEDREGNLWVGTEGGGLTRVRPSVVDLVDVNSGVPFETVRSVCQDTDGTLWAVAQSGAVTRNQNSRWRAMTTNEGWRGNYATCVAADPRGGVWIGTQYKGLYRWDQDAVETNYSRGSGLADNYVSALLTTKDHEVWIGTERVDGLNHTLQRMQTSQFKSFILPSGSGLVVAMAVDTSSNFWAATAGGRLFRISHDLMMDESDKTLGVAQGIRCLLATPDGSLWIGYAGAGVGRLKENRFTQYRVEQGLHDDYITQIVPDGRGRLWFAGNRGIFRVNQNDFDEVAEGRMAQVWSVAIGRNEGLAGLQSSYGYWPGAFLDAENKLWIPMQSGLLELRASELKDNDKSPLVAIERVQVDGQTMAAYDDVETSASKQPGSTADLRKPGARLFLPPGHQQVQFDFTAISLSAPENVVCKYKLQNLDAEWVNAGAQRVAHYPHLPPGDYAFRVIACNNNGVWNETGATLALTAEPHFWETTLFRVAAPTSIFGLVGSGGLLMIRQRHRRQIERLEMQRATERERARIAQDLHDDLGAGLTQISLNTIMVQNPAVGPQEASTMLQEIEQRARDLVVALDEIVWAVNPKNDTVPSLIRYLCQFTQSCLAPLDMACRLEVPEILPPATVGAEQRHHLFLAFKEAINNILRHSGAKQLRLEITASNQELTLVLTDTGRGFAPGAQREGADGLHNMRDRMQRLGGSCVVASTPGKGTVVTFHLPLGGEQS